MFHDSPSYLRFKKEIEEFIDSCKCEKKMADTCFEMTIIVKDDERSLRTKHLVYDRCMLDEDDPIIKAYVDSAIKDFNAEPTDVKVKILMQVR